MIKNKQKFTEEVQIVHRLQYDNVTVDDILH